MYVRRIRLTNIRQFKSLDLEITRGSSFNREPTASATANKPTSSLKPRMRSVFIGKNGTGKSTLLRCLALALTASVSGRHTLMQQFGSSLVGSAGDAGVIELDCVPYDGKRSVLELHLRLQIDRNGSFGMRQNASKPASIQTGLEIDRETDIGLRAKFASNPGVFGYGPGRFSNGPVSSVADSTSFCRTLFRFDERLVDPELALRRLRDFLGTSIYDSTMTGIKRAIGLRPTDQITVEKGGGVVVHTKSGRFPLSAMADGHRVPFGFALDLYHSALQANAVTKTGGIRGVLLLDEIEQHLHPELQEGVLRRFGRLWPELQIFATTHSPLVALGAKPDEVVSLKRRGATVSAIWPVPNFSAFTADDMLEEQQLFDTVAMTTASAQELAKYQTLAAIPRAKRSKSQNAQLKKLATAQLSGQPEAAQSNPLGDLMSDVRKKFGL